MAFHFDQSSDALRKRLFDQLGDQFTAFEIAMAQSSPTSIRLNPRKMNGLFDNQEKVLWCPQGRYLESRPNFTLDPLFHAGTYYVQEASSMFLYHVVDQVLDTSRNLRVLDLCAAPGGKTSLLQGMLHHNSVLVANEVISGRNKILRQNMIRWGGDNHIITQNDPKSFQKLPGFFDLVLLDAPCSGEGLLRKEPSAIEQWSERNVLHCASRQRRILSDVIPALAPGGFLIYSTCTFSEIENELNMKWLQENSDLTPLTLEIPDFWGIHQEDHGFPAYRMYPHRLKGEGFFIAVFQKTSGKPFQSKIMRSTFRANRFEGSIQEDNFWLKAPERYDFLIRDQHRIAIPKALSKDFLDLSLNLRITSSGLNLGKMYHGELKPSPELALSQHVSIDLPNISLDSECALDYLAHININHGLENTEGRYLVSHGGYGLGWLHVLKTGQIRNNYPSAWRILKRHPQK
ncbi:RNA methyltransferase [bacterium]|nr:RNA methyltransferase [bacterium]